MRRRSDTFITTYPIINVIIIDVMRGIILISSCVGVGVEISFDDDIIYFYNYTQIIL